MNRSLTTLGLAVVPTLMGVALAAPGSAATAATYRATAGISPRQSATAAPVPGYGAPAGAALAVECQVTGEPVGPRGNTLYFLVIYDGRTFFAPDTWTDSPHRAGEPPLPGIPMCGGTTVAAATGARTGPPAGIGCYGHHCSGRLAERTGCDRDAVTVAFKTLKSARLELRWSATCKTNWARFQQYPRGWFMGEVPLELRAVQQGTNYTQRLSYGASGGTPEGTTWTPMIYSPHKRVRAEMVLTCGGVGDCAVSALTGNPAVTAWR